MCNLGAHSLIVLKHVRVVLERKSRVESTHDVQFGRTAAPP